MSSDVTILTTHTGSLPRPADLTRMLVSRDQGEVSAALPTRIHAAVGEVVSEQLNAGIAVVNDGEASKINYSTYVVERLSGFEGVTEARPGLPDGWEDYPAFFKSRAPVMLARPACVGQVKHRDLTPALTDVANLKQALMGKQAADAFMTAASPGVISAFLENRFYESHEEYIWALADAMKPEYDAIHAGGFLLQIDCPDLPAQADHQTLAMHIDAINYATRDIPAERMRLHLCWGNYEGPHNRDVPLEQIIDRVLLARPAYLSFEAANPRHAHEWRVFTERRLPEGKRLIPGVIDSTTNYIEHPRLVADRILSYARAVGPENVVAGTDCGLATVASHLIVDPAIAWAKLGALADGAALASADLSMKAR